MEPCEELFQAVHTMEHVFRLRYEKKLSPPNVALQLFTAIHPQCNFQFLFIRHPENACYLSEKLYHCSSVLCC